MNNKEWSNLQAIKDCIELTQHYPLEECLQKAKEMCDTLGHSKEFEKLMHRTRHDKCLDAITDLAIGKWGARNVFSALLYLAGNIDGSQLQLKIYEYDSKKAFRDINKLLEG
jgi:hypothetical protein